MEGFWPIFFLLVVLKIPVFGALWLVWWASRAPEPDGAEDDSGEGFDRWRPQPHRPRGPHPLPGGAGALARRRGAPLSTRHPVRHSTSAKSAAGGAARTQR
jgi:hypothetical protein